MTSSVYRVLHECGGVLPSFTVFFSGSDPTLLSLIDFYWVLPSFTEFFFGFDWSWHWVYRPCHERGGVLPSFTGFSAVLTQHHLICLISTGFYRVFLALVRFFFAVLTQRFQV